LNENSHFSRPPKEFENYASVMSSFRCSTIAP
jgi:hypothetical protein